MCERTEFPGAEVSGEEDHALAAAYAFGKIFKAVIDDIFGNVGSVQFGKVAEFDEQASQIIEAGPQNGFLFGGAEVRASSYSDFSIRIALAFGKLKAHPRCDSSGAEGKFPRHPPENPEQGDCSGVFGCGFNAIFHPWYLRIL